MITNLGLLKVPVTVKAGKFIGEVLKNELMSISIDNSGNAIVETGLIQIVGSSWIYRKIIAFWDAVFIEYND